MKISNVRFAYSVKVGPKEITYANSCDFGLVFMEDRLTIKDSAGNTCIVFPSNIAYMVPDEKETNSTKEKPKKATSRNSPQKD